MERPAFGRASERISLLSTNPKAPWNEAIGTVQVFPPCLVPSAVTNFGEFTVELHVKVPAVVAGENLMPSNPMAFRSILPIFYYSPAQKSDPLLGASIDGPKIRIHPETSAATQRRAAMGHGAAPQGPDQPRTIEATLRWRVRTTFPLVEGNTIRVRFVSLERTHSLSPSDAAAASALDGPSLEVTGYPISQACGYSVPQMPVGPTGRGVEGAAAAAAPSVPEPGSMEIDESTVMADVEPIDRVSGPESNGGSGACGAAGTGSLANSFAAVVLPFTQVVPVLPRRVGVEVVASSTASRDVGLLIELFRLRLGQPKLTHLSDQLHVAIVEYALSANWYATIEYLESYRRMCCALHEAQIYALRPTDVNGYFPLSGVFSGVQGQAQAADAQGAAAAAGGDAGGAAPFPVAPQAAGYGSDGIDAEGNGYGFFTESSTPMDSEAESDSEMGDVAGMATPSLTEARGDGGFGIMQHA